jgi:microcompartment protein CcmL/EutN
MELESIGFLELNSIAKGIESVDFMLKTAEVRLIMAKASCPGKYYIMIAGGVSQVEQAMRVGTDNGGKHVVGKLLIPRIHPDVIHGINMSDVPTEISAIGVMEYYSATGSIIAADAAVKAAAVRIIEIRLATGIAGKSFVILTGDVSAVEQAVQNGIEAAREEALLINKVVLAHPEKALIESLLK